MRKGMAMGPVIGLALAIIAGLAFIGLQPSAKAKLGQSEGGVDKAGEQLLDFGCTNINDKGAGDSDKKSATFQEFMDAMNEVYKNCNAAGSSCSGTDVCRKMTLDLGGAGNYYKIDYTVLKNRGLNNFNGISIAGILCNGKPAARAYDFIYPTYSGSIYKLGDSIDWGDYVADIKKTDDGVTVCESHTYFEISHGSKIRIKAKKETSFLAGTRVNLNVNVDGGSYKILQTVPLIPQCTPPDDSPCNKAPNPSWGYCDGGSCSNKYCSKTGAKCKTFTVPCTLNGNCGSPSTITDCNAPSVFFKANTWKTEITGLVEENGKKLVKAKIISPFGSSDEIKLGEKAEYWFTEGSSVPVMSTTENDVNAKVSVWVKDIQKTNEVLLAQGCY